MNPHRFYQQFTTNAAEGLPRRRLTIADVERMTEAEILGYDERFELIGGEIVPMIPKSVDHEVVKNTLNLLWCRALPPELHVIVATTFRLTEDTFLEPDIIFYPASGGWLGLNANSARLVVEIADHSLEYDLGRKALIYANFGISELWVIDAVKLETHIHRDPGPDGYRYKRQLGPNDRLVPQASPTLAVTLSGLDWV
jgi:Uma2 family endonuclease